MIIVNLVLNENVRTISRDTDSFVSVYFSFGYVASSALCAFVSVVVSASSCAIYGILYL